MSIHHSVQIILMQIPKYPTQSPDAACTWPACTSSSSKGVVRPLARKASLVRAPISKAISHRLLFDSPFVSNKLCSPITNTNNAHLDHLDWDLRNHGGKYSPLFLDSLSRRRDTSVLSFHWVRRRDSAGAKSSSRFLHLHLHLQLQHHQHTSFPKAILRLLPTASADHLILSKPSSGLGKSARSGISVHRRQKRSQSSNR